MATIFQKSALTGVDQCIVLNSQEGYTMSITGVGNWNELRISALLSYCGISGFNSNIYTESLGNTTPKAGWYWGLGTFTSSNLPLTSGCNFVGVSTYPNTSNSTQIFFYSNASSVTYHFDGVDLYYLASNNTNSTNSVNINQIGNSNASFPCFPPYGNTGNSNYCAPNSLIFKMTGQNQTGQSIFCYSNFDEVGGVPTLNSYGDLFSLRLSSINLNHTGTAGSNLANFYWTTGFVATGGPLPIPNTMFIYSPFFYNLLRVHNVIIEKFA